LIPSPLTSTEDGQREGEDKGCFDVTFERKYYRRGDAFIKRCLRPREFRTGFRCLHVPRFRKEALTNEAASLRYIRRHTDIPVPTVYADFEDDDAYYLIAEYIEGESMSKLSEEKKATVREELEAHLAKLQGLRSKQLGGPSGIVIPPYRVVYKTDRKSDNGSLRASNREKYVFCHNDLSQHNVIVDPETVNI